MTTTYREAIGGYDILVDGKPAGFIPAEGPRAQELEARAAKREVTIAKARPEAPPEPVTPAMTADQLAALLVEKKILSQEDLDAARE